MTPWSLKKRLLRNVLLAVGFGWIATLSVGIYALNHEMGEVLDGALKDDAALVAQLLAHDQTQAIATWANSHAQNTDWQMRILLPEGPATAAPWPALGRDGISQTEDWQVVRQTTPDGVIEIGQSLKRRSHELMEAARAFLFLIIPLLLIVTAAVILTLRKSLSSTIAFSHRMRRRSAEDLSPLSADMLPQEMAPVTDAFNIYLDRIKDLRAAERHFIANAAHELRTPLAVLRSRIEVMAATPQAAQADARRDLIDTIDRLSLRVERLLQLERAEAGLGLARERIDIVALIRLLCHELRPNSNGQPPILFDDSDLDRLDISSDRDALAIILRNLLGNARDHGTGTVRLQLSPQGRLRVTNPAPPEASFHLERFGKSGGSAGSGLGLDIVMRLARDLGIPTRFEILPRETGPLAQVTLDLPVCTKDQ
ncbi:histidine kinase dimerization/phospho-acceptor domain-containing protein [Thioclava litoralis]|uniref:histidine kinase n=1 Tax=Thioclava litoralis TaxID=3076557 RepID=A0ABZ1DXK9_9RHOB|nr:histidine kinase dimerization/phospho-acceptor domain-containing protein [Thioclava sp. FTW29]